jgi:hypothetical protein
MPALGAILGFSRSPTGFEDSFQIRRARSIAPLITTPSSTSVSMRTTRHSKRSTAATSSAARALGRSGARVLGCSGARALGRSGARALGRSGAEIIDHLGPSEEPGRDFGADQVGPHPLEMDAMHLAFDMPGGIVTRVELSQG